MLCAPPSNKTFSVAYIRSSGCAFVKCKSHSLWKRMNFLCHLSKQPHHKFLKHAYCSTENIQQVCVCAWSKLLHCQQWGNVSIVNYIMVFTLGRGYSPVCKHFVVFFKDTIWENLSLETKCFWKVFEEWERVCKESSYASNALFSTPCCDTSGHTSCICF